MDLHILRAVAAIIFFSFFLPGYPLSRSVSNARYVTSRVPAYKEVKDVWKCSCRSNTYIYINVYIRVFSSLGILCDFISLALVINCFSIFLFFFYTKGERRPRGGNYLSILLLERLFSERSLIILIYEKLDRSVKSVRFAKKYLNNCSLAVFRRFEQTFVHYRVFLPWQLFDPPCPLFRRLNFRRTFIAARILVCFVIQTWEILLKLIRHFPMYGRGTKRISKFAKIPLRVINFTNLSPCSI